MNKPVLIAVVLIVAVISLPLLAKMAGGQRVGQDAVRSQGSDGNTLAIEGVWEGALSVPGTQTAVRIVFRISESPDGTFSAAADSPDQGTRDIPVDEITLENRNLRLQLDSISGVFAGQVQEDGMAIHGTWQQDGQTLPLVLERATSRTGTTQSEVGPLGADVFKIKDVDVGDQSWGLNLLRVSVENLSGEPQPFWLHVGGRYQDTGRPRGFGMGMEEPVVLDAHEERIVEHPYWIPPQVGELSYGVKFVLPTGSTPPWEQEPFLRETYTVTYETPNRRCNELTPLPQFFESDWLEKYREGARIRPFEVVSTEYFVFYVLPDSPAAKEIEAIQGRRERVMEEVCDFLGVSVDARINFFLFPDAASKRWCMGHQGDGLAFDATIAEIYSEDTRLDPAHELTHIVASQIGSPPALLNEGLATYMQAGHRWNDEHVDRTAAELLREGKLASLTELIKRTEIGSRPDDGKVAYPQSASFVKFVIDTHGREKFLKLYGKLTNGAEDNATRFEEVLNVELGTAEKEWLNALETVQRE